jgi:hypothetical protein
MLEIQLHFISAILILLVGVVPIYLTIRLRNNLRKLVLMLAIFILIHVVYHIVGFLDLTFVTEGVFEPPSVAELISFGIVYSGIARPKNLGLKIIMVLVWIPGTLVLLIDKIARILLLIAMGILVWLAILSKNIRSFQFQLAGILRDNGIIVLFKLENFKLYKQMLV